MFELGRHGGFILASYIATVLIIGGLVFASLRAYFKTKAQLTARERSGS
jgi:heme exporter protein CcmD